MSQNKESFGSSLPLDLPYKKCERNSSCWKERTLISNVKTYENIQHNGKGK